MMTLEAQVEQQIRQYLLGQLAETEQTHVEERMMTDDEYFELLLVIEDELIDEGASGALSAADQEWFDGYFLSTPERRERVMFAESLKEHVAKSVAADAVPMTRSDPVRVLPPRPAWWKLSNPYLRMAAAAIILLAVGLGTWRTFFHPSEVSKGMAALREAYRAQRPTEARITGLGYAPPPTSTRGSEQEKYDYVARDGAEALIRDAVRKHPDAQSYHDLGRLYLAKHEYDKAIDQFEKALKLNEKNALLHSDLGAAYLERALSDRNRPNISDLDKSLEELKRAIELDDSLLAAYFNKALCLQRMNAWALARAAWEDYLKKDAHSEWSKEAERNLQVLQNQRANNKTPEEVYQDFLAAYRQQDEARAWRIQSQTKEMITGTMIAFQLAQRFAATNLANQHRAAEEILGVFRFAGELERKQTSDPFFAELAEFYSGARGKNVALLSQAQKALQQGYQLCLQGRYSDAMLFFENAQSLFLRAGNILESKVVDYWRAYCLSYAGELKKSSALLWTLAEDCQRQHYHWLESQSYSWLANNGEQRGEYSEGVEQNNKALRIAAANDDLYLAQKTASQVANEYKLLRRLREALEFNQQSLPSVDAYFVSLRQFWRSLYSITDTLFALRLYSAAEAYEQEALQLALNHLDDPALTNSTYRRLGQIYAGQGNYSAAAQAFALSLKALQPIAHDPICKKLSGLSILQIANVKRQMGDYPSALDYYRQAAQEFDSSEFGLHNYTTHKGLLLCHLLTKNDSAIQQELPLVLSLFEQNRQKIKEELSRNHFFDAEQGVYELAIDYEYERNNKEQSFHYVELSRARSLQDAIIGGTTASNDSVTSDAVVDAVSQPLTLAQLQERLPANLKLVEYAVLQNRLLAWVMTKTRFEVVEKPVSMAALEALTNEYLQVLTRNDAVSIEREKQLAAELHDWLFAPLEDYLNKADEVALVPDKFLFKVPFAALLARGGERVVNDYTLLYAPSATVLVLCSDLARMKAQDKETERLLSVGDPLFDHQQHRDLRDLQSAAYEAKAVASFYHTKAVFIREEALKERIEPELRQSDVIHFAAHYLTDDFSPAKSRLLLTAKRKTKTNETSDDLSLQEIQTMRLPRAKVAILSACQSGIERYYAGEGLIGLSRAFLVAGIPLVIASQWPVESDSTANLMIEFHKLRKVKNMSATEALRQAQIAMLSHEDERYRRPYYWAAFFPIGGYASY